MAAGDRRSAGESRHFTWPSAAAGACGRPVRMCLLSNSFQRRGLAAHPTKNAPPASCAGGAFGKAPGGVRGLHGSLPACAVHGVRRTRGALAHGLIGTGEERTPPLDDPRSPPMGFDGVPVSLHVVRICAVRGPHGPFRSFLCPAFLCPASFSRDGMAFADPGAPHTGPGSSPDPAKKNRAADAVTGRLAPGCLRSGRDSQSARVVS